MHTIEVSRTLEHPADEVWSLIDDFGNTFVHHPIVEHSSTTNGVPRGVGAERQCTMYDGNQVRERIVSHDAISRRYTVEVIDHGPFPLVFMAVDIAVEALSDTQSRLTYVGRFKPKYGPVGWLMGKAMMESGFTKMLGQVIEGAGTHLETGRIVEKNGELGALRGAA